MSKAYAEPELLAARHPHHEAYVLLAPALLFLGLFFLYPVLWLAVVSTAKYNPVTSTARSTALGHYSVVLSSPALWRSILNTAYFSVVYVPLTLLSAGALAMLLNRRIVGRPLLKAVFCAPAVVPVVGAALIWRAAYMPVTGSVDRILFILGHDHSGAWAGWLGEPYLAMPCIALMCVWRDAGLFALILLAALGRIPRETYEMAHIDGASRRQAFTSVTLPMCLGTLGLCLVMLVINVQNVFQEIYVMTEDGGPANWTVNISFLVYRRAYGYVDPRWGEAAALSVVLFAVTVVLILIQNRILNRRLDWS